MADAFRTTRWSVVMAAGQGTADSGVSPEDSERALETLCQTYWFPIYAYIRHRTDQESDAQDLTQAFFAQLLSREALASADPDRGRFRAWLLTVCKNFLSGERDRDQAAKRGGGSQPLSLDFANADSRYNDVPADQVTADDLFEQQWAVALIDSAMGELRRSYQERSREPLFEALKAGLAGQRGESYGEIASRLEISETAVKVEAHRMKSRYRELIRAEIGHTLEASADVEQEIRRLFEVLSRKNGNRR